MSVHTHPEFKCGNIMVRINTMTEVGDVIHGHTHNFDHMTLFQKGAFHVRAVHPNGAVEERDFVAPTFVLIRKDVEHEITATALSDDGTAEPWCIYSHRDPQGRIVQEYDGWTEAYQ